MPNQRSYRILIIDGNVSILQDFKKILMPTAADVLDVGEFSHLLDPTHKEEHEDNYELDYVDQGHVGYQLVQDAIEAGRPYALIFIDMRMPPGWDGIETLERIWEIDKRVQTVLCSDHIDYSWEEIIKQLGKSDRLIILKKPFDLIEIKQLATALTEKWRLKQLENIQLAKIQQLVGERTADLLHANALLRATLAGTYDGILVIRQKMISEYNQTFVEMWKLDAEQLEWENEDKLNKWMLDQLVSPEDIFATNERLKFENHVGSYNVMRFLDGRVFERYSQPLYVNESIVGRIWNFRDVTKRIKLEEQLVHQTTHDLLTGLPNRKVLFDKIQDAITRSKKINKKFAVLLFDLDHFKLVNDSLGHEIGDQLLESVASRLKSNIQLVDSIGRLGGDEFVILIEQLEKEEDLLPYLQKLLTQLSEPFIIEKHVLNVTACVGISFYPKDGELPEVVLKKADISMYRAKDLGHNCFQFYNLDMATHTEDKLELVNHLKFALEKNQFILHYQPYIDLKTNRVAGVEALIRWNHPTRGFMMPGHFIPAAEETGLIEEIGAWVLLTACQQIVSWQKQGLPTISIAVNFSPLQFKRGNLIKVIDNVLNETKIDPHLISCEITESLLLEANDGTQTILKYIRNQGIQVAIDDFGMGFANLSLLSKFAVDKLKIDRSFVRNLHTDPQAQAVVLAIINMAKSLGLHVVAEGVETIEQLTYLRNNHCDVIQGYLFSRPQEANACVPLFSRVFF